MALLWTSETLHSYDQFCEERGVAYRSGDFAESVRLGREACDLAMANEDAVRAAINMRDVAFALQKHPGNESLSLAWDGASLAVRLTEPFETQETYGLETKVAPILSPRREQAANHLCRLRIALSALKGGYEIDSLDGEEDMLRAADSDHTKFVNLLALSAEEQHRPDQYWVNAQQDVMLLERMHGRLSLRTYLSCIGTVALSESTYVAHSPNKSLFNASRLKTVARQAGRVTQNLLAHR